MLRDFPSILVTWGLRDYGVVGQLGLERTPEEFVVRLVGILEEVRRVLRDDGTLWLNLGDSYATGAGKACSPGGGVQGEAFQGPRGYRGEHDASPKHAQVPDEKNPRAGIPTFQPNRMPIVGLKPKDLVGVPWRVAFALQAKGWYLRSDIIWAKPAPMPESVTDRPTRSHEHIFLLSKSERYYYDSAAIAEPATGWNGSSFDDPRDLLLYPNIGRKPRLGAYNGKHSGTDKQASGRRMIDATASARANGAPHDNPFGETRNKRDVWTVNTDPFPEAHFATFPPALILPCVLAGCPPAGKRCDCSEVIETPLGDGETEDPTMTTGRAGMNRVRRPDEGTRRITRLEQREYARQMRESPHRAEMASAAGQAFDHYIRTDLSGARPLPPGLLAAWLECGWLVSAPRECGCPTEPAGIVLDPFFGAGTTGLVAKENGRRCIGIELSEPYCEIAKRRLRQEVFDFQEATAL